MPFTTTDEMIGSAISGLERYQYLHELLEREIRSKKFYKKAGKCGIDHLCNQGPLNIFYMLATVGAGTTLPLIPLYDPILLGIEESIATLSILKSERASQSLCKKFLNLGNEETLSTISELSIGRHFHENGYMVEFEVPFICDRSEVLSSAKDIDMRVTYGSMVYLIEVYNPFQTIKDLEDCNSGMQNPAKSFVSPSQEEIVRKIRRKTEDKFGPNGSRIIEPDGRLLLAVNLDYTEELSVFRYFGLDQSFEKYLCHGLEDISALDGLLTYQLPIDGTILGTVKPKWSLRDESGHFSN
ncbi:MAG: hypothetical protein WD032_02630 [Nitrospirales bacterium]